MISSFDIQNFRCFDHLAVEGVRRFNVIVGDNGAGKTALLEALFLALSGSVEVSIRFRQQRGFDGNLAGSPRSMEEAIWRDLFFEYDWRRNIQIKLNGDGAERRQLTISRGQTGGQLIPFEAGDGRDASQGAPLTFTWLDANNVQHPYVPQITPQGVQTGISNEDLPSFFHFPANQTPGASETASRFSSLSTESREGLFVKIFTKEFPWIEDLSIEVAGGFPVIHATIQNNKRKQPLNSLSGGINRVLAIMLALAAEEKAVVLVDEIEDGLYYKHKIPLWRGILDLARENNCQMFLTTHDEEWLGALAEAGADDLGDVALWRVERLESGRRVLKQFTGQAMRSNIKFGGDPR